MFLAAVLKKSPQRLIDTTRVLGVIQNLMSPWGVFPPPSAGQALSKDGQTDLILCTASLRCYEHRTKRLHKSVQDWV